MQIKLDKSERLRRLRAVNVSLGAVRSRINWYKARGGRVPPDVREAEEALLDMDAELQKGVP